MVELGFKQVDPTAMNQENIGTICRTNDVPELRKVKHIGIRFHVVRDAIKNHLIVVVHTP